MKKTFKGILLGLALAVMICCFCAGTSYAQGAPNIAVKVSQKTLADGRVNYRYRVINDRVIKNTSNTITRFEIGYDYYHGVAELKVPPVGWTFESGIPQASTKSPPNWRVDLITTEESPYLNLEWRNNGSSNILPGKVASGFSVTVPEADNHYLTGHWTVLFADSGISSGVLVMDDTVTDDVDTTPPNISVTLKPNILWPPKSQNGFHQ